MEFIWGENFWQENFKGRVISVRTGLFFYRKFHNPRHSTGVPLILAHSRKIKNSFASSVLNSSFVCQNDLSHSKSPPVIIIMTDLEH